jgi:hypothetical protein
MKTRSRIERNEKIRRLHSNDFLFAIKFSGAVLLFALLVFLGLCFAGVVVIGSLYALLMVLFWAFIIVVLSVVLFFVLSLLDLVPISIRQKVAKLLKIGEPSDSG